MEHLRPAPQSKQLLASRDSEEVWAERLQEYEALEHPDHEHRGTPRVRMPIRASPSRRLMWSAASVASAAKGVAHAMPSVTNTLAAVSRRIQSQRRASLGIALLLVP
jgi:hypothetical protein